MTVKEAKVMKMKPVFKEAAVTIIEIWYQYCFTTIELIVGSNSKHLKMLLLYPLILIITIKATLATRSKTQKSGIYVTQY